MASGRILVAQGGGPTAVINQSLVGVALEARRFSQIGQIYGALHGVRGIVDENFVDLTQETSHNLELVASTPSMPMAALFTSPQNTPWRVVRSCTIPGMAARSLTSKDRNSARPPEPSTSAW